MTIPPSKEVSDEQSRRHFEDQWTPDDQRMLYGFIAFVFLFFAALMAIAWVIWEV